MPFDSLFNPTALLLVVGGTLAATLLRCGWAEIGNTGRMIARLFRKRFSEARVRGSLAIQVQQIKAEGLLRAQLMPIADREIAEGVAVMMQRLSADAFLQHHEQRRVHRERIASDAVRTLNIAADLAPVFGLAGTLVALTQLPTAGLAPEAISGTVSAAVLTTLYGVLSANLFYAPLARQIGRVAEREEIDRQAIVDWMAAQIAMTNAPAQSASGSVSRMARAKSA